MLLVLCQLNVFPGLRRNWDLLGRRLGGSGGEGEEPVLLSAVSRREGEPGGRNRWGSGGRISLGEWLISDHIRGTQLILLDHDRYRSVADQMEQLNIS